MTKVTHFVTHCLRRRAQLLPGRPMEIVSYPEKDGYICTIKLYGSMPVTAPYAVRLPRHS
jgi:hypothetical protein